MIYLYCKHKSPRHDYIFHVIFHHWMGLEYLQIADPAEADSTKGFLINYSDRNHGKGLWICDAGLLSEQGIHPMTPALGKFQQVTTLFPCDDKKAALPFDIFSAVFFMISRYEEYLTFPSDKHGRFEAAQSLQYAEGFHHVPVVDFWVKALEDLLKKKSPTLQTKAAQFSFQPTYDIDQYWAFLHKGLWRNTAGYFKDWFNGAAISKGLRRKVLNKKVADPFDSFAYLEQLNKTHQLSPIYFIHPGTYGTFDKNISLKNKHARALVLSLAQQHTVGLHPSYKSAKDATLLKKELELLSAVIGSKVTRIRHHYLRISIPDTYRLYTELGITDDYSLGWATDRGFRAGCSRSFPFYDLEREQMSPLMLHPLSMMDGALKTYRNLRPYEARMEIESMIHLIKEVNGTFVSLWHNESLGTTPQWSGWREVYEFLIACAQAPYKPEADE